MLKFLVILIVSVCTGLSFAGTMGGVRSNINQFYLGGEGGASISLNTYFSPNAEQGNNAFSWLTPVNRDFTSNFGIGSLGGVFLGYQFNPNVAFQFTYDYRGGYSLFVNNNLGFTQTDTILNSYQEYYSAQGIKFQSFLYDMILSPEVDWGGFVPYVKAGIGFSINTIGTLQNFGYYNNAGYRTYLNGETSTSFAWDAGVGVNYFFNDKLSIGLGYRFVDVGRLTSSNTFYEGTSNAYFQSRSPLTISPLQASNVFLNEVVASITYHFDYM